MNKKQGDQRQFSGEKRLKKKENGFITCQPIWLVDGSCYKVIDSSVLQEVFSSVSKFLLNTGEETAELN